MGRALLGLVVVALWAGGCSSSPPSDCLTETVAKVCLSLDGGVRVSGQGLEPGSDLTVQLVDGPAQVVQVDETGSVGTVGFLAVVVPDAATVDITGLAQGGEPLSGTLSVG